MNENCLPRYKTAIDRRSPAPDPENFQKWVFLGKSQRAQDFGNFRKPSENLRAGVGVGVEVGGGVGECITEVVGAVETSENPNQNPHNKAQIVQRGQERLVQLRQEREHKQQQKQPQQIADLFAIAGQRLG